MVAPNLVALWLAAATLYAAHPFEGRWAMQAPEGRVFWLEVKSDLSGSFFGATGGRLAKLLESRVDRGQLSFAVERVFESNRNVRAVTSARRAGAGLEGSTTIDGKTWQWKGWRSPEILERDDASWRPGTPIRLLQDGEALRIRSDHWALEHGVLTNRIPKADLAVTRQSFWNFTLHAEYRLPKNGNSGIGLRHHYELQLADDYGQAPDVHGNVSLYSRIAPRVNASKPPGEWQTLDLRLVGRDLTVMLNGVKVIERQIIEGLCGLALNPHEEQPGPVSLQGDHGPVEFRNVVITPLSRNSQ